MEPVRFLKLAHDIYIDTNASRPPDDGVAAETHQVIPPAVARGSRGYIEKVVNQINGSYEKGWFDACAVMMRRLLETVIIECFEHHGMSAEIKNRNGDYYFLRDLISTTLQTSTWTLSRNTRSALPRLKNIGDKSAHSRRYIAHRQDIDSVQSDFRGAVQEFMYLAKLK